MSDTPTFLARSSLFALLDEDERVALAQRLEARRFAAGQTLFERGDPGAVLFLVKTGRVRTSLRNDAGETIVLAEHVPGDVFGEISLFDGRPRTATALAAEDSEVLTLEREDLLPFLTVHPHAALDLLAVMAGRLRESGDILRRSVIRNLNETHVEQMTVGERIADRVATFGGSWTFILFFGLVLTSWMGINIFLLVDRPFDPYPFILLNLLLSTIAALQAPVIMMSQNRQAAKDRLQADLDFEINRKAELEIAHLHLKVDRISELLQAQLAGERRNSSSLDEPPLGPGTESGKNRRSPGASSHGAG